MVEATTFRCGHPRAEANTVSWKSWPNHCRQCQVDRLRRQRAEMGPEEHRAYVEGAYQRVLKQRRLKAGEQNG